VGSANPAGGLVSSILFWRKSNRSIFDLDDREFLPAALEILETPPSPVRMWMLIAICAFVAIAVAWMFMGHIDIIAVARGKIQPTGHVKLVQPLETGKVSNLFVSNGSNVDAGQEVIKLDDSEAKAEVKSLEAVVASARAESVRRNAAIAAALDKNLTAPEVNWPSSLTKEVVERETRVLASDLKLLSSSLADIAAQREQKQAERTRLLDTIASQKELLKIEDQRVQLRSQLEGRKLGSKLTLFDALETLQNQRTSLAQQEGQLAEAAAALNVFDQNAIKTVSTFVADNSQKAAEADRQAQETAQKLVKARVRASNMVLTAPVSGTVQALSITTLGQVVMPGEEVMRIVPHNPGFEIECYVANKDIGFISVGQKAVIKVESFPFTRYGSLPGHVARISDEAIPEPDAQQREADPSRSSPSRLMAGAQRVQNLVFPVTIALEKNVISAGEREVPVSNGMAVSVEVKTGRRRIIDYIFSPLVEVTSEAMKER
jgi:hemolysin D